MSKSLVVKEFEEIISEDKKQAWMNCHSLPSKSFNDLKTFIEEFNADGDTSDALEFMRISYKRDYGDVITVKNYVGLIQLKDGTQIEILPKISYEEDEDNAISKRVFLKMLRSLKDFSGKAFNSANLNTDRMNLYEIFISMYLEEVRYLIKKGMKSFYERKEDNLRVYKGKIKIKEQTSINAIHKERFYVEYDEYTANRPENRLIKSALLKLQKVSNYIENITEIRNLLNNFEFIDISSNYDKDFSQVVISRENREYETLMNWSKVFLYDRSFTTFSGSTIAKAIMFPMEKIFESYVASEIKKVTRDEYWEVSTQDRGLFLFDSPEKFSLRPDIVIRKNKTDLIVLDTKWKILIDNERRNYGISQADMYQMYAYAKKYEAEKVIVIYPMNPEMERYEDSISFRSEDNVDVNLFLIDLINIEDSIKKVYDQL
ncbi:MAG: McrC family protein [Bacilli bacterium]